MGKASIIIYKASGMLKVGNKKSEADDRTKELKRKRQSMY